MATQYNVQNGMTVRSYDGDKLGKVVQTEGGTFIVEKGIFFPKDYSVSTDQIDEITDDGVYLKWGTDLIEQKYDQSYGAGAYKSETTGQDWVPFSRGKPAAKATKGKKAKTGEATLPVIEEQITAEKKGMREVGEVRIHKTVKTEEKHFTVPVTREEVVVDRVAGDQAAASPAEAQGAFEEKTISMPIREEEVEISKQPVVKEEIRAHTEERHEERPVAGEVRREEVHIEKNTGAEGRE